MLLLKISRSSFNPLIMRNPSPGRKCAPLRKFGLNLPIRKTDFWNAITLCPFSRSVLSFYILNQEKFDIYHIPQKLSGVFEVRIYPVQNSIPNILAATRVVDNPENVSLSRVSNGVDLSKLHAALGTIDYASIRARRATYSRLYHEALISHQPGRGIAFTDMLFLLAHHKIIVDREALMCVCFHDNRSLE